MQKLCGPTTTPMKKETSKYTMLSHAIDDRDEKEIAEQFGVQLNQYLYILRCYEHFKWSSEKKYKYARKLIDNIYKILNKRQLFLRDSVFWKDLYARSIYYYEYLNGFSKIGNIPLCQVSKHNQIIPVWLEHIRDRGNLGMVLHFDSHSDTNDILYPMQLRKSARKIINHSDTKRDWNVINKLVWDIGAPMTAHMIANHANNLIWAIPAWLKEPERNCEIFLTAFNNDTQQRKINNTLYRKMMKYKDDSSVYFIFDKKYKQFGGPDANYISPNKAERASLDNIRNLLEQTNDVSSLDPEARRLFSIFEKFNLKLIRPDASKNGWEKIAQILSKKYVLDIDLDYFVCNGFETFDKEEYYQDAYDVRSARRVLIGDLSINPRAVYDNDLYESLTKRMKTEITEIKKRIKKFLKGITYLKKKGCVPSLISICDSTGAEICPKKYFTFGNEYVPRYYAYWLHQEVQSGLSKIFLAY